MTAAHRDNHLESRLLGAVLAFVLAKGMVNAALWVLSAESVTGRIAHMSTYPHAIAALWVVLSVLVLPYLLLQLLGRLEQFRVVFTRLACRAILASGVIWSYLAYLSKNVEYANVTVIFLLDGLACVCTAAILANSINSAQRRAEESQL